MELIDHPKLYKPLAEKSINKYGYAPEHNIFWYEYVAEPSQKTIFVHWPDDTGLLTHKEEKAWYILSEPLAPERKRGRRIAEFADYALKQTSIKKVVVELRNDSRKETLSALPENLKALAINYTLVWPIMNLEKFNVELDGGHFKSIRHARNKFYREHKISVLNADTEPPQILHRLVEVWRERRGGSDRACYHKYHAVIDNKFNGCKSARVMMVDGQIIGFNAGWEVPNSDQYYAAIGVHDYSTRDQGLMLYLEDLEWIKKAGYKKADMGGGEKALTYFKNQFLPESWYKTFVFSITIPSQSANYN